MVRGSSPSWVDVVLELVVDLMERVQQLVVHGPSFFRSRLEVAAEV
jgi:hypothetical protein